ncbi:MAG TPA: type II toxin-antitoxin system RelE/ParE family toxin [Prolixibacteraceae bacterium]|nr:type II toxin-antitoxin system RelE/ParE family toxin [Prolixibacteraceae bacterium]HPS13179.1 type II toxin-antitoxin system RelE/ParE family toxin [Prolixibacteraceae bacterium]
MNQIIWAPEAEDDFSKILSYLNDKWEEKVALNFVNQVDDVLIQIKNNPSQFPLFLSSQNIHRCVINKQNTIFYRIENHSIFILRLFDTRQNPDKLEI